MRGARGSLRVAALWRRLRPCAATAVLGAALACCALSAGAQAAVPARLVARFTPLRLGGRTTLAFGFAFSAPAGQVPPPLTEVQLRYPNDLGIGLSGLGEATCDARTLEALGPQRCPPNSVMGYGVAYTGIVLGTTPIRESAPITIVRAPNTGGGALTLLFYAEGTAPVETKVVFPGLLLPAHSPFGGLVSIPIPLVPTLPGAPYISVIHLRATIGPLGVTYFERVAGTTLAYKPRGILLPPACPRGGFPFAARFGFSDGTFSAAGASIPCPPRKKR